MYVNPYEKHTSPVEDAVFFPQGVCVWISNGEVHYSSLPY